MARYASLLIGFVVLAVSSAAHAQVVDTVPTRFTPPAGMFTSAPRLTSPEDGQRIIRATLGSSASYGQQVVDTITDKDFYVIIHLLKWAAPTFDASGVASQTVQEQNWYIYRGGSGWSQTDFSAKRMYGGKGFYLLAIHLNRDERVGYYRLNYRYTITKKQAANITNLLAAAKLLGAGALSGSSVSDPKPMHLWAGRHVPVDDVPSDISIVPEIVPIDTPPAEAQVAPAVGNPVAAPGVFGNLPPIAGNGQQGGQQPAGGPQPARGQQQPAAPAPQTQTEKDLALLRQQFAELERKLEAARTTPTSKDPQSLGATHKIDNEGKYHWDVSVGIPVRSVNDFTRTETGIDVKTVNKNTVFVLANIYFKPVDVKTPALNAFPSLLLGVGIEKEPLGRFFIGGGWGPVYANFFAGVSFKKIENSSDYKTEVTFGLNVPILSITKRLAEQAK